MDLVVSPTLLYSLVALGALGIAVALPRRGPNPQILGMLLLAAAGGLLVLLLTLRGVRTDEGIANVFFYVFSVIAIGASLRVITHRRPVYAALYFVLTILATSGLFLILSAEFMAAALVIIYAGAILITYLFVIMLATQSATAEAVEQLADYDEKAYEPAIAAGVGFLLLAGLTTVLFGGATDLGQRQRPDVAMVVAAQHAELANMRGRVESALRSDLRARPSEAFRQAAGARAETIASTSPAALMADGWRLITTNRDRTAVIAKGDRSIELDWPADLQLSNVEAVGFNMLRRHPGSIEIAGVILLMAMLGSVVLARRKAQEDEDDKLDQARRLSLADPVLAERAQGVAP